MMSKKSLNKSVELLAYAMQQVLIETVKDAVEPLRNDIVGTRDIINSVATKADIEALNENMLAQFTEQEKKIEQLVKNRMSDGNWQ